MLQRPDSMFRAQLDQNRSESNQSPGFYENNLSRGGPSRSDKYQIFGEQAREFTAKDDERLVTFAGASSSSHRIREGSPNFASPKSLVDKSIGQKGKPPKQPMHATNHIIFDHSAKVRPDPVPLLKLETQPLSAAPVDNAEKTESNNELSRANSTDNDMEAMFEGTRGSGVYGGDPFSNGLNTGKILSR